MITKKVKSSLFLPVRKNEINNNKSSSMVLESIYTQSKLIDFILV